MLRCSTFYQRRDYKRRRTASSTFVSVAYTPISRRVLLSTGAVVTPPRPSSSGTVDGSSRSRPSGPTVGSDDAHGGFNNHAANGSDANGSKTDWLIYRGAQRLKKVRENFPQALSTRTLVCKDHFVFDSNPGSTTATKMILKVPTNSEMGVYGSFLLSID